MRPHSMAAGIRLGAPATLIQGNVLLMVSFLFLFLPSLIQVIYQGFGGF